MKAYIYTREHATQPHKTRTTKIVCRFIFGAPARRVFPDQPMNEVRH